MRSDVAVALLFFILLVIFVQLHSPAEVSHTAPATTTSAALLLQQRASAATVAATRQFVVEQMMPPPPPPADLPEPPPPGVDLTRATLAALTRGCNGGRTSGDGVTCTSEAITDLLSRPPATRFDASRRNPCTATHCVPYFYILGSFHTGARDLFDRLHDAHPHTLFVPKKRRDGYAPYYFSETHMWERMLWRGCDYGECPRRRGAGADPLPLSELGLFDNAKAFGEVAGGALTFTWSSAHSVLHWAWDKNQSQCRLPHPRMPCFPAACEAQRQWEASIGGGNERQFTIPWLMRGVHGTDKVRLIGLMREPGERMWSAYHFWPQYRRRYDRKGGGGFHEYVKQMTEAFNACLNAAKDQFIRGKATSVEEERRETQRLLEHCAINFESLSAANEGVYYHADQLLKSLYVAYVPTWRRAFGSKRLLLLRAEDYWARPVETLQQVSTFLGIGQPSAESLKAAASAPIRVLHGSNATFWGDKSVVNRHVAVSKVNEPGHTRSRIKEPMAPEARQLLSSFFGPHNKELARILGDARFEWADVLGAAP